ncbi:WD40 repeat-like protein [Mycena venus]|uniref:WD40 repeat-like protein n=1 Tax=Mycena venus TaxID=2733690 RepID=A0A8H6TZ09_9AGAR|nr:WD40 repeat-like protein [Mycena venus]
MNADGNHRPMSISKHVQFHIYSVHSNSSLNSASKVPRAYVRVRIADRNDSLKTGLHLGPIDRACWQESLAPLVLKDLSRVTFELRHRPAWKPRSSQIAETRSYSLSKLLEMQGAEKDIFLPLCANQDQSSAGAVEIGSLRVSVRALSSLEATKLFLLSAENSVNDLRRSSKTAARYKAGCEALNPICGILDIVGPLIAFSPEPICTAVVGVVRGAAKSVKEQIEQDADVLALIKTIEDIYCMVAGTTELHTERECMSVALEHTLRELVTALGDCTRFMLAFCKSSFLGRVARTAEKAKELKELHAGWHSQRKKLSRDVEMIAADVALDHLACVHMSTDGRPQCTDGAHAATLAAIKLWLTGAAPIVTTLFLDCLDAHHLVGNFFFEKDQPKRDPALLIQTLAAQLASSHDADALKIAIAQRIQADENIMNRCLEEQFEQLLLMPLLAQVPARPIMLLVDGLEWCGTGKGQEESAEQDMLKRVLRVLVEGSAHFPPSVRLLISGWQDQSVLLLENCDRVENLISL